MNVFSNNLSAIVKCSSEDLIQKTKPGVTEINEFEYGSETITLNAFWVLPTVKIVMQGTKSTTLSNIWPATKKFPIETLLECIQRIVTGKNEFEY